MTEILLPTGIITPFGVIPLPSAQLVSGAVDNLRAIDDLTHRLGGRDVKPTKPILLHGPDPSIKTVIVTDGETTAAELQDLAYATFERQQERMKKTGRAMNFEEFRERAGWIRKEKWGSAAAEALRERARQHKANPISDPARRPQYYSKRELEEIQDECARILDDR